MHAGPLDHVGTELPPRRTLAWLALAVGLVFLPLPVQVWQDARESGPAAAAALAAAVGLLLVVLPLWAAARLLRQRFLVAADRVTVCRGRRAVRELRFAHLVEVRAVVDGQAGGATGESWNRAVVLLARTPEGRRTGLKVTRQQVQTLDPLLRALRPVVAARPGLVRSEASRRLFEEYLREAGA